MSDKNVFDMTVDEMLAYGKDFWQFDEKINLFNEQHEKVEDVCFKQALEGLPLNLRPFLERGHIKIQDDDNPILYISILCNIPGCSSIELRYQILDRRERICFDLFEAFASIEFLRLERPQFYIISPVISVSDFDNSVLLDQEYFQVLTDNFAAVLYRAQKAYVHWEGFEERFENAEKENKKLWDLYCQRLGLDFVENDVQTEKLKLIPTVAELAVAFDGIDDGDPGDRIPLYLKVMAGCMLRMVNKEIPDPEIPHITFAEYKSEPPF